MYKKRSEKEIRIGLKSEIESRASFGNRLCAMVMYFARAHCVDIVP